MKLSSAKLVLIIIVVYSYTAFGKPVDGDSKVQESDHKNELDNNSVPVEPALEPVDFEDESSDPIPNIIPPKTKEEETKKAAIPSLTVISAGNVSGWVDQLDLQKGLPLPKLNEKLTELGPVEVSIQIFDIRVNHKKPVGLLDSLTYFSDHADTDCSEEEEVDEDDDELGSDEDEEELSDADLNLLGLQQQNEREGSSTPASSTPYLETFKLNKVILMRVKEQDPVTADDVPTLTKLTAPFCASLFTKYNAWLDRGSPNPSKPDISIGTLPTSELYSLFQCHEAYNLLREAVEGDKSLNNATPAPVTTTTTTASPASVRIVRLDRDGEVYKVEQSLVIPSETGTSSPAPISNDIEKNSVTVEQNDYVVTDATAAASASTTSTTNEDCTEDDGKDQQYLLLSEEGIGVMIFIVILAFFSTIFALHIIGLLIDYIRGMQQRRTKAKQVLMLPKVSKDSKTQSLCVKVPYGAQVGVMVV